MSQALILVVAARLLGYPSEAFQIDQAPDLFLHLLPGREDCRQLLSALGSQRYEFHSAIDEISLHRQQTQLDRVRYDAAQRSLIRTHVGGQAPHRNGLGDEHGPEQCDLARADSGRPKGVIVEPLYQSADDAQIVEGAYRGQLAHLLQRCFGGRRRRFFHSYSELARRRSIRLMPIGRSALALALFNH